MTTPAAPPIAERMMHMRMIALRGMKLGLLMVCDVTGMIVQLHRPVVVDVSVVVDVTVGGIAVEV
jgi:hypothetical protein